jgi:hypothetical protein
VRGNGRRKIRTEPLATDLEAAIIVRADRPDAIPWLFYSRVYLQVLAKYLRPEIEIVVQPLAGDISMITGASISFSRTHHRRCDAGHCSGTHGEGPERQPRPVALISARDELRLR